LARTGGIDGGEDANEDDANEDDGDVVDAEHDDMESVFDDMDGENDDSDADEDPEEAEHASWFGRRPSDILKSKSFPRRTAHRSWPDSLLPSF